MDRKKLKCSKCNEDKFCYPFEIQIIVYKEPALATKIEDWACLECIYNLAKDVDRFGRKELKSDEWLQENEPQK